MKRDHYAEQNRLVIAMYRLLRERKRFDDYGGTAAEIADNDKRLNLARKALVDFHARIATNATAGDGSDVRQARVGKRGRGKAQAAGGETPP